MNQFQLLSMLGESVRGMYDEAFLAACADKYLALFDTGTNQPRNPEAAQKLLKDSATLSFEGWVVRCNADTSLLEMQ